MGRPRAAPTGQQVAEARRPPPPFGPGPNGIVCRAACDGTADAIRIAVLENGYGALVVGYEFRIVRQDSEASLDRRESVLVR